MSLRILHVLDHSIPLHSGYTFRSLAILKEQRRRGWETMQLTSSKHYGATADEEVFDGFRFYRTRVPTGGWRSTPILDQWAVIRDLERRITDVIEQGRDPISSMRTPHA